MVDVERFLFGHGILDSFVRGLVGSLRSHGTRLSLSRQSNPCLGQRKDVGRVLVGNS